MTIKKLYPGGRRKAATFSYDDGHLHDLPLLDLFHKYNLKGTFNLSSGWILKPTEGIVTAAQVHDLYAGQEIAVHCVHHPHLKALPSDEIREEVALDMIQLSEITGYPVRGMAYPYGEYNDEILKILSDIGIRYSRTCKDHFTFALPEKPLEWGATCRHTAPNLFDLIQAFDVSGDELPLLYIWGHSFEFAHQEKWELAEQMCRAVSKLADTWFATNMEILDYLETEKKLEITAEGIKNPAERSVWVSIDGAVREIAPGASI